MSSLNATNASFIVGFIVLVSLCRDMASQHGKGRNISVTRLRYSANHNVLDSWPIRAHLASQNDELCKNRCFSERFQLKCKSVAIGTSRVNKKPYIQDKINTCGSWQYIDQKSVQETEHYLNITVHSLRQTGKSDSFRELDSDS